MSASPAEYDEHAQEAIDLARRSSADARLGHIGTEHLLLGLLGTRDSGAQRALASLGVTLPKVEDELVEQSMRTQRIILSEQMASVLADQVFKAARLRADAAGRASVSSSDLLMGLVEVREGVAAKILVELGVGFEQVARALSQPDQ